MINNNLKDCHIQLSGTSHYDNNNFFMFVPNNPVVGQVDKFRCMGMAQQMADGTFDFVRQPKLRAQSRLIRKLAHGRVSETKDGAIQLTLKVFKTEGLNIGKTLRRETSEAIEGLTKEQLSR